MMRQSSSRIHRNRGWKVKHVLQICILATVCVWLIYQVKHSHERRSSSEDVLSKPSEAVDEIRPENLKLGRKDPQEKTVPLVTDASEELEEVEDKSEQEQEKLDEGGEDIDEVDHERSEIEDEDSEIKEKDSDLSEIEEADEKSQEAREENYKADDVASAVSKDGEEEAAEFSKDQPIKGQDALESSKDQPIKGQDALESSKDQQIKGQDAPEFRAPANQTDIITKEEHHDNSSSPNEELVIGPPPNSTLATISPGSIVDNHDTSSSSFDELLKDTSSNHDNSTVQEPINHDDEISPGNSTNSGVDDRNDHGDSSLTELANSTTSDRENPIFDSGNQPDNSSQLVSAGDDTQSTETQKSETETVEVSTPAVDQNKTTVDYDALRHEMEAPKASDGADEDRGALTKGRAQE